MSSSTTSLNNDPTSPYYIHPSDFPNHMYVNEALSDGNYGNWVQEMENFLFAKNKIGFVDGTIKKPEEATELMAWRRCDAMVKGWITTALAKEIRNSVRYAKTATEIWKDLQERFKKESAPRAYELKRTLTLTRQENSSVSTYFTKLRSLWDEIDSVSPTPNCSVVLSSHGAQKSNRLYLVLRQKQSIEPWRPLLVKFYGYDGYYVS